PCHGRKNRSCCNTGSDLLQTKQSNSRSRQPPSDRSPHTAPSHETRLFERTILPGACFSSCSPKERMGDSQDRDCSGLNNEHSSGRRLHFRLATGQSIFHFPLDICHLSL